MASLNMVKVNMANMNTLFRKGYFLAGVVMAANMFVVNEVRAMKTNDNEKGKKVDLIDEKEVDLINKKKKGKKKGKKSGEQGFFDKVLYYENTINLIGGTVSSVANNYLKLWDYNAGSYCNLRIGCLGWRTKKFFDIVQVGINLNLGRGILWLIPGTYNYIKACTEKKKDYVRPLYFSFLVADSVKKFFTTTDLAFTIALIFFFLLQGFVSAPLTFHISNFSISISIDSMLWAGIGKLLDEGEGKDIKINLNNKNADTE